VAPTGDDTGATVAAERDAEAQQVIGEEYNVAGPGTESVPVIR
jgi:hypothetical protein